jgi:hypothetical protein
LFAVNAWLDVAVERAEFHESQAVVEATRLLPLAPVSTRQTINPDLSTDSVDLRYKQPRRLTKDALSPPPSDSVHVALQKD